MCSVRVFTKARGHGTNWFGLVRFGLYSLYGIHNLGPAALGCVYPVETSTSLYNLY